MPAPLRPTAGVPASSLIELGGLFLALVGCGLLVAAAALVSVALALLVAGVLVVFVGLVLVYVANARTAKPEQPPR